MDYAPNSAFGWLDYDEHEARRMREVLDAFDEKKTVDSLGFGTIRDAFSDLLFPGTSTIQTRVRYFLFIPWIFRHLEDRQMNPSTFLKELRTEEGLLIKALRGVGPSQGVIGYRAGADVGRLPSVVYWNGLGRYRIRLTAGSLADYRNELTRAQKRRRHDQRDDDRNLLTDPLLNWDPHLPDMPEGFPHHPLDFHLSPDEANYLADRIVASCPGSFMSRIAADPSLANNFAFPWEIPQKKLSPELKRQLHHAQCFSEIVHGAQLLYNLLCVDRAASELKASEPSWTHDIRTSISKWQQMVEYRMAVLGPWFESIDDFWELTNSRARISGGTQEFVMEWCKRALSDPQKATVVGPSSYDLIAQREHRIKGRWSRLGDRRALEGWPRKSPLGESQLDFRWRIAASHAREIADGQET